MKDNAGKILLSLLAGATAGVVAGLLLAPETGEDTRASLKESADKLGDDINKLLKKSQQTINEAKGNATDLVGKGRTAANEAFNSLSAQASTLTDQAKQYTSELTDQAKQYGSELTDQAKNYTSELTDQAKEYTDKAKEYAADLTGQAKETAADVADKAKETAASATNQAKQTTAEIADEAKEIEEKTIAKVQQAPSPQPTPKVDPIVAKAQAAKDNNSSANA